MSSKNILITGGASGIGSEIVRSLLKKKHTVISIDLKKNKDSDLVNKKNLHQFMFNLNNYDKITDFYSKILKKFKHFDVLINNARSGTKTKPGVKTKFIDENLKNWDATFNVNLNSHFFLSKEFIFSKKNKKKSYIINISSISGQFITSLSPAYNISKAALIHMSNYLAYEGIPHNCNSNVILPAMIVQKRHLKKFNSKTNKSYREASFFALNYGRVGNENDIAECLLFLISGKADFLNGSCLNLDGGSSKVEQIDLLHRYNEFQNIG